MSLLWVEGFENFNSSNVNISNIIDVKYSTRFREVLLVNGRFGGKAASFSSPIGNISTPTFEIKNTLIVGMAWYETTLNNITSANIIDFRRNGVNQFRLGLEGVSGQLNLSFGTNVLLSGKNSFIRPNKWNYIEVKATFLISGSYEIRLNGKVIGSATGIDTRSSGADGSNQVFFGTYLGYIDDIYVCDDSGVINNDFLGDTQVVGLLPDNDGFHSDLMPDSGTDHFSRVNELPPGLNNTTYIESSTSGHIDTFTYTNISGTNFTDVAGLQVNTIARKTDLGGSQISTVLRSSSTDVNGDTLTLGDDFENHEQIFETDIAGTAWTISSVNASEFGVEVE